MLSWAMEMLSAEAIDTLVRYDISCAKELIHLVDEEWVPIPWLLGLGEDHPPGGPENYAILHDLLALLPPMTVDGDVMPLQTKDKCFPQIRTSIPIAREQMCRSSPTQYFRVAGILPDGRVSGRFYSPGKTKAVRHCIRLDPQRPFSRRGSGFDTSISQAEIQADSTRRVFVRMSGQRLYWDVVFEHPARQIANHASLPTSSLIPPLPSCLAPVRKFLVEAEITLTHISSDAGFSQTGGLPSLSHVATRGLQLYCLLCGGVRQVRSRELPSRCCDSN
jgi:hypothetical protein